MPKYREKLAEVEAVVWDGNAETANAFLGRRSLDWQYAGSEAGAIRVVTFGGNATAEVGDYIVKDESGNPFVMNPGAFARSYEAI